jgi:hypothetical protein
VLQDRFAVLRHIQVSAGGARIEIGQKGRCRFCRMDNVTFRHVAHAFPEALGNKWALSIDECDACNTLLSVYESALVQGVSPLLTLGGVKGKSNNIRQTGRSAGNAILSRDERGERPQISAIAKEFDLAQVLGVDPSNGVVRLRVPVAGVPFSPRRAYKALCKMAYALFPDEELGNHELLRKQLLNPQEDGSGEVLDVALSMTSLGNAPALATGTLLKRTREADLVPELLFLFSAGSLCLQINLWSDAFAHQRPYCAFGSVNIRWVNMIGDGSGKPGIAIEYGDPTHFDWTNLKTQPQPIEALILEFNPTTAAGKFIPVLRS